MAFTETQTVQFLFQRVENILAKGENDGYKYFIHFPKFFSTDIYLRGVKSHHCVVKG